MLFALFTLGLLSFVFGAKNKSACRLELAKIALQPQSCAYDFLERVAREVHNPKYRWFADSVVNVATQFYGDNFVSLNIVDAFGNVIVEVNASGLASYSLNFVPFYWFDTMRTMGTGLKTNLRIGSLQVYFITQLVWGPLGQLYIITVSQSKLY